MIWWSKLRPPKALRDKLSVQTCPAKAQKPGDGTPRHPVVRIRFHSHPSRDLEVRQVPKGWPPRRNFDRLPRREAFTSVSGHPVQGPRIGLHLQCGCVRLPVRCGHLGLRPVAQRHLCLDLGGAGDQQAVAWCSARTVTGWRIIKSIHQPVKPRAPHHLSSILICALTMSLTLAVVLRVEFKKLGKQD